MFFLDFLRWLRGYVVFTSSGGFTERFFNLCASKGIDLKKARLFENRIIAQVDAKDYKKLRSISKRSGMKIRAEKKAGLYFFLKKHKNRVGLVFGAAFFAVFLYITSLFIWSVDVVGCENVSRELVQSTLSQIGVHEGVLKKHIDAGDAAAKAMIELNAKVSWLAVNIKGTHAVIEVRDFIAKREDVTYTEPCNIVADFDGLIMTLEVYHGQKANTEGGGVKKGDLLISGIFENRNTSSQFMEARGRITALHTVKTESSVSEKIRCKKYTSVKTRKSISFLSLKLPLGLFAGTKESYDSFESSRQLSYGGKKLPFAIIYETRAYYKTGTLTDENFALRAKDEFVTENFERFKNTLILSSSVGFSEKEGSVIITGENECIDFMGVKEKIF